jgi:hypothetical protein
LQYVDTEHTFNTRVDVYAEKITLTGFDLVFHTWADTKVYNLGTVWVATGDC